MTDATDPSPDPTSTDAAAPDRGVIGLRALLLYVLAVAAYTLPFIGARALFYRDEVRYGGIVSEMIERGAWLTQTIAGTPYLDKGPIYFMALRLGAEIAGGPSPAVFFAVNAVTVFLFAVLAHVAFRWLGTPERLATRAGLILLSLPFVAFYALTLRMDPLFAGVILLSFAAFARALEAARPRAWFVAGGVLAGLAVLIKGPFGVIFPVGGIVAAALVTGRARRLASRDFALALAACAGLVAAWFLALLIAFGWPAMVNIVEVQIVERAVNSVDGRKPWSTYLTATPAVLLPWLLLAPALIGARTFRERPQILWLVFTLAALIVMQSVAQKSAKYLFPVLPPMALWLAIALARTETRAPWAPRLVLAVTGAVLFVTFAALWIGVTWEAAWLADALEQAPGAHLAAFALWGCLSAAPVLGAVWLRGSARILAVILGTAILFTGLKASLTEDLNRLYDPGPAVALLTEALPAEAPVVVVDIYRGAFSWHLDRPHVYVFGQAAAAEAVAATPGPLGLLIDDRLADPVPDWLSDAEKIGEQRLESTRVGIYLRP
jgi:4-amino-4-deoxy-L-arabinose transferase-like glycosyltransferase